MTVITQCALSVHITLLSPTLHVEGPKPQGSVTPTQIVYLQFKALKKY